MGSRQPLSVCLHTTAECGGWWIRGRNTVVVVVVVGSTVILLLSISSFTVGASMTMKL